MIPGRRLVIGAAGLASFAVAAIVYYEPWLRPCPPALLFGAIVSLPASVAAWAITRRRAALCFLCLISVLALAALLPLTASVRRSLTIKNDGVEAAAVLFRSKGGKRRKRLELAPGEERVFSYYVGDVARGAPPLPCSMTVWIGTQTVERQLYLPLSTREAPSISVSASSGGVRVDLSESLRNE